MSFRIITREIQRNYYVNYIYIYIYMEPLNMPEILFYKPDSELNEKFKKLEGDKQEEFIEMLNKCFLEKNGPIIFPPMPNKQNIDIKDASVYYGTKKDGTKVTLDQLPGWSSLSPEGKEQRIYNAVRKELEFQQQQPKINSKVFNLLISKLEDIDLIDLVDASDLMDLRSRLNTLKSDRKESKKRPKKGSKKPNSGAKQKRRKGNKKSLRKILKEKPKKKKHKGKKKLTKQL
jgi:hypothetical protein